jgi:hypothetical protein
MNPDEMKELWRSQLTGRRLALDAQILLLQLERNKRDYRAIGVWSTVLQVGGSCLLAAFFGWYGCKDRVWPLFAIAAGVVLSAAVLVRDRMRQRRRRDSKLEPVLACVQQSMVQVEHEIRLWRSAVWWLVTPLGVGFALFAAFLFWQLRQAGWWLLAPAGMAAFWGASLWGVNWVIQRWATRDLQPRHQELEQLLTSLKQTDA